MCASILYGTESSPDERAQVAARGVYDVSLLGLREVGRCMDDAWRREVPTTTEGRGGHTYEYTSDMPYPPSSARYIQLHTFSLGSLDTATTTTITPQAAAAPPRRRSQHQGTGQRLNQARVHLIISTVPAIAPLPPRSLALTTRRACRAGRTG